MRLDQGTGTEFSHSQVPVTLPNGSVGTMAVHVINGTSARVDEREAGRYRRWQTTQLVEDGR
jgi:hypothetical protein